MKFNGLLDASIFQILQLQTVEGQVGLDRCDSEGVPYVDTIFNFQWHIFIFAQQAMGASMEAW